MMQAVAGTFGPRLEAWMLRFALLLFFPVCCAAACPPLAAGEWPSLAARSGELAPLVPRPSVAGRAGDATIAVPAADAAARLASVERDIAALAARVAEQAAAGVRAAGASGDTAEAARELERSRADHLSGQARDLRDRLDELAGDLARRAAAGDDVLADLRRAGTAIERVEALRGPAPAAPRPRPTSLPAR